MPAAAAIRYLVWQDGGECAFLHGANQTGHAPCGGGVHSGAEVLATGAYQFIHFRQPGRGKHGMQAELGGQPEIEHLPASQMRCQNHHRFAFMHRLTQGGVAIHCHDSFQALLRVPPEQGDLEGVAGTFLQGLSGQLVAPCFIQLRVAQRQIDPGHAPGFSGESGQQSPEQTGDAAVHSVRKKSDQSQRGDCGHTFNSLDFWIGSSAHGERV